MCMCVYVCILRVALVKYPMECLSSSMFISNLCGSPGSTGFPNHCPKPAMRMARFVNLHPRRTQKSVQRVAPLQACQLQM